MNTEYLEVADRICGRLCRDALWSNGLCNWTGDRLGGIGASGAIHGSLLPHLYSGTAGIALALWRIAAVTGDSIHRFTARGAIARSLSLLPVRHNGFYAGGLGIRYAAAEILGELDQPAILREAACDRETLDIVSGSAGAIPALLYFHRRTGSASYLELAIRHGDLLIAEAIHEAIHDAIHQDDTWSWNTILGTRRATGFAHGTAGIGWALLELWRATGEARFRDAARGAFRYERACFHPVERNWPDFRGEEPVYQSVWCHGAGGIAYSRLRAWQILPDPEFLEEAHIALEIVRTGFDRLQNFSLCHGTAGNADLMIYAAEVLGENPSRDLMIYAAEVLGENPSRDREGALPPGSEWMTAAESAAQEGMARYHRPRAPWPSGMLRAQQTPDLMWGNAGIAYFYLRLASVGAVPTLLLPCQENFATEP